MNLSASKKCLFFFPRNSGTCVFPKDLNGETFAVYESTAFPTLMMPLKPINTLDAEESHQLAGNGQKEPCHYASVGA